MANDEFHSMLVMTRGGMKYNKWKIAKQCVCLLSGLIALGCWLEVVPCSLICCAKMLNIIGKIGAISMCCEFSVVLVSCKRFSKSGTLAVCDVILQAYQW